MRTLVNALTPLLASTLLSAPVLAQVANDDCAGALAISSGLTVGSNTGATTSVPTGSCSTMGDDVWFKWTADCSGPVTVNVCGGGGTADFDTIIAVFDGDCAGLTEISCNDDSCGLQSSVSWVATLGTDYYVAVGGYTNTSGVTAQGNFTLNLQCLTNDDCLSAIPLANGLTSGSNSGATTGTQGASCGNLGAEVWYAYTAPGPGNLTVSLCAPGGTANYDTAMAAYTGTCGSLTEVACDDDTCGLQSELNFPVTAGTTYYIAVGGYTGVSGTPAQGDFTLAVRCTNCALPASEVVRLGNPPNPNAFLPGVTSGPVIGATWDPIIDHTSFVPGSLADFMIVTPLPTNSDFGAPTGVLLCDPTTSFLKVITATPGNAFSFPIPNVASFVGVTLCAQAGSIDPGFNAILTNALDLTVGQF